MALAAGVRLDGKLPADWWRWVPGRAAGTFGALLIPSVVAGPGRPECALDARRAKQQSRSAIEVFT